jgi:hypothetical protein
MKDYIINSFILQDKNTLIEIYNYIKVRYENSIEINYIKIELANLIKNNIIVFHNNNYELTKEGNVVLTDHKYYYSKIINRFYKKYNKKYNTNQRKYDLREVRKEQQHLRGYLIANKQHRCILCDKELPLCLLETAHIKPRCILNNTEMNDINVVEFMCRYCHNLYDNGFLSVHNGLLQVSTFINNYDLQYNKNKQIVFYNSQNAKYFGFHYKYIYKINTE